MIDVIDSRGRVLTPCRRKVAEREVRLNRAKWIGPRRIRLRFDPFAYRYIRLKILARDGNICYWCGEPGDTMDHIIPWSKGGRTTMDNCICACMECNGQRGDMPAAEFARLRGVPLPRPVGATPATEPARLAMGAGPVPVPLPTPMLEPVPKLAPAPAPEPERVALLQPYALRDLLDPYVRPVYRHA
ncbi:MAG TPA: HNH endonuclease [Symbiobacteriaceae bacterium]|nr:HNH endonuclease [Symbiobacteriaceae bacterium]